MPAAHVIYANEMTSLMHGYPLWEPECRPQVSIADVGYLRNGRFCRLFNASLPPGHPLNEFGEPDGYEPLNLDDRAMVERRLPPGPLASRSITKNGGSMNFSGSMLQAGLGFDFSCATDRGAILIINSEARRKDSEQRGAFKKYMLSHYKSWYAFANNDQNSRDISISDLVFVTGRDNTADWAVAAFSERSTSGGVHFQASFPNVAGAQFSIWGSWSGLTSVHSHCGPRIFRNSISTELATTSEEQVGNVCAADLDEYDQCIFIRGLRVMARSSQVRQKIGLKVPGNSGGLELLQQPWMSRTSSSGDGSATIKGLSNSTGGSWGKQHTQAAGTSTLDKRDNSKDVEIVSSEVESCAPVQLLLAYILEKNPEVSVAIAHDDDLAAIIKENDSLDFDILLSEVSPSVVVDSEGVGTIERVSPPVVVDSEGAGANSLDVSDSPPIIQDKVQDADNSHPVLLRQLGNSDQYVKESELQKKPPPQPRRRPTRPNGGTTKPDSAAYDKQQECIKTKINAVQARLNETQGKISLIARKGPGAERQTTLRVELDSLRDQQLASKASRDAMTTEFKKAQEEIRIKIKDLQGLAKKLPAKTIDELESKARTLDRKVEAGNMGLSEEKKVVGQINSLRRSQTAIEFYQTLQASVETAREKADGLRKQLGSRPADLSERYNAVRAELDALQRERDEAFANREQLYRERDGLQRQLSALHEQRRQTAIQFREERDAYWQKLNEDRAQEASRLRAEKSAQEERKRAEARERLLEKARVPAFAAEIRDCLSLLEYFSGKADYPSRSVSSQQSTAQRPSQSPSSENHPGPGWVPLKKKTENESFFIGGKGKAKKGQRRESSSVSTPSKISIPLGIMSTLMSLAIAPPTMTSEVPTIIEDIMKKIEWFEANQTKATEENVARTEADLNRIGHVTNTLSIST